MILIKKNPLRFVIICSLLLFFHSCASRPVKSTSYEIVGSSSTTHLPPSVKTPIIRHDIFHTVAPGETLWRISKMYDVEICDILTANKLKSETRINMGQRLLIPDAAPLKPIIPLYKSQKWQYIIIHHSATDVGNALTFYDMHLRRGFWNGLGYHFVIDNGTFGKEVGQIEISPRWIKQQNGAHCKASNMNYKGIGICLVGNYSKDMVSSKQMDSLIYLVRILKKYYNIPYKNIMGHGQVPGAATECPGLRFPWSQFWRKLRSKE